MVVIFSIFFCILMGGLFGGTLYALVEKLRLIKALNTELHELRARQQAATDLLSIRDRILLDAKQAADVLKTEARRDAENRERAGQKDVDDRAKIVQKLNQEIEERRAENKTLNQLNQDLSETVKLYNLNFYEPKYNFERSLDFERALNTNRNDQKAIIKNDNATTWDGYSGDKKISGLLQKLLLRTFNSECDLLIQGVDYKNIVVYENRINNSFEQLNRLTLKYGVMITDEYLKLKLAELRICHEYQEKKQQEAEEQRQIKEIMRDEIRAEREMEKAKADAEREEQKYQSLLDKMLEAARQAQGAELDRMNAQIAILQQQLDEAKEKERSISQAQLTKAGYVYVISNVGSFGENVFKVGMTRRLEPQERVDELGDASVPFQFDVHAMIYRENAPEFETALHQELEPFRVNKINPRKEFFRISLDQIEEIARKYKADISITKLAEAKEYRQTLAIEQQQKTA